MTRKKKKGAGKECITPILFLVFLGLLSRPHQSAFDRGGRERERERVLYTPHSLCLGSSEPFLSFSLSRWLDGIVKRPDLSARLPEIQSGCRRRKQDKARSTHKNALAYPYILSPVPPRSQHIATMPCDREPMARRPVLASPSSQCELSSQRPAMSPPRRGDHRVIHLVKVIVSSLGVLHSLRTWRVTIGNVCTP